MAFGILEPKTSSLNVPGTTFLDVHDEASIDSSQYLKKGTGRNAHVVLIPQPSNDPNDPLNWPLWQRDLLFLLLSVCTLLTVGGFGPIPSPIAGILLTEFNITFTQVSILAGYSLCATGAIGVFMATACNKYVKRPVLLFSLSCAFAGSLWAAAANSYNSFLGARILQGLSMAFFESVMYSVIGDIYYVHERGTRTALYITMYSGLGNLPILVAGVVSETLGWRWIFWLLALFSGLLLVLCFFFAWETSYNGDAIYDVDNSSQDNLHMIEEVKMQKETRQENLEQVMSGPPPKRHSIGRRMLPWTGVTYTEVPLWRLILAPFLICYHPAVIWATVTLSFPVLWLVGITVVIAQISTAPPYNLSSKEIGYMSAGPIVFGTFANLIIALLSDWSVKWCSRRNGGKYEPEFRMFILAGLIVCSLIGYYLFGYLVGEGSSPVIISVAYGLATAACQFSAVAVGTYMVDAYRSLSVNVFIVTMVAKNFLFFGFTFFINKWVVRQGAKNFFYTIGGIQTDLVLLSIPFYMYGKGMRAWWHTQQFA